MINFSDPTSTASAFPITCWAFKTTGVGNGVVVRFPEGFYIKIYYSEKQKDAYDIIGGWSGEASPSLNITVPEKDMKQWCSRITSARAFMEVVYASRASRSY